MAERGTMPAFVLHGAKDLRMEQVPCPVPGSGEVLVAVQEILAPVLNTQWRFDALLGNE